MNKKMTRLFASIILFLAVLTVGIASMLVPLQVKAWDADPEGGRCNCSAAGKDGIKVDNGPCRIQDCDIRTN